MVAAGKATLIIICLCLGAFACTDPNVEIPKQEIRKNPDNAEAHY